MSPTSVATILFDARGQALILRRGPTAPWMPGRWNLPGGSLDEGETWVEGAARETEEETQLVVRRAQYLVTLGDPTEGWAVAFFVVRPSEWSGQLVLNYESDAYAWVTPERLDDYAFVPTVKEALLQAFTTLRRPNARVPSQKRYLGRGASATAYSTDDDAVYLHVYRDDGARQVLARLYAEGVPHMPAIEVVGEGWYRMPHYHVPPLEGGPADDLLEVLLTVAYVTKGGLSTTAARLPDLERYDSLREALYALARALGAGWVLDPKPENFGEDEQGNLIFLDPVYSPTIWTSLSAR